MLRIGLVLVFQGWIRVEVGVWEALKTSICRLGNGRLDARARWLRILDGLDGLSLGT